jgi:hypothetical protein
MITDEDFYYFPNKDPDRPAIAIAFGINGKVILDLPTYVDFYDLLMDADEVIGNNDDYSNISLVKNGNLLANIQTSSFLGSLIASSPDILEIYRPPNFDQLQKNQSVSSGWLYDENGEFRLPYEGWDTEMIDGIYNVDREPRYLDYYTGE